MAISFNTADGKLTVTLTYKSDTANMSAVLESAVRGLMDSYFGLDIDEEGNRITYESMTVAERMALIDLFVKQSILSYAYAYNKKAALQGVEDGVPKPVLDS